MLFSLFPLVSDVLLHDLKRRAAARNRAMNDSIHRPLGLGGVVHTSLFGFVAITQARQSFLHLADQVQDEPVFVTRRGKPVMAMLSADQYEGLLETLEILQDEAFAKRLPLKAAATS